MSKFLMAVLQIDSQDNKRANLDKVGRFIDKAASHGAQFVAMAENVHYWAPRMVSSPTPNRFRGR